MTLHLRSLVQALLTVGAVSCSALHVAPPTYEPVLLESGVLIRDQVVPEEGPLAREGDLVHLHYEMRLADGTVVDSSFDRGQPLETRLGDGLLPPGVEQGVVGMRRFGRRELVVPAALGYGDEGLPPSVPANAELHLDLELMELETR